MSCSDLRNEHILHPVEYYAPIPLSHAEADKELSEWLDGRGYDSFTILVLEEFLNYLYEVKLKEKHEYV